MIVDISPSYIFTLIYRFWISRQTLRLPKIAGMTNLAYEPWKNPRHVDVPVQICDDPDAFQYPKGLICAGEPCNYFKNSIHLLFWPLLLSSNYHFFLLAHDSCQGDSGGPLMNIREENGESKYEWVGKFVLKSVLFITCSYYEITNS